MTEISLVDCTELHKNYLFYLHHLGVPISEN